MGEAAESDSIEQRAKAAGAEAQAIAEAERKGRVRGGRLNAAGKATRDLLIVQRVSEGWSWAMIADEAGVTARQCQRIAEAYRELPSPLSIDATTHVEELARGYRQSVAAFTALAAGADNTAAAVGALKGANDAREKMLMVLQAIGHVPHDLGTLKLQRDVTQVALTMLDTMEAFERGELDVAAVMDVFRDLMGIGMQQALSA